MRLEGLSHPNGVPIRIDVKYDPRNLAPVGALFVCIEDADVGDRMLLILLGEGGRIGRSNIGDDRI